MPAGRPETAVFDPDEVFRRHNLNYSSETIAAAAKPSNRKSFVDKAFGINVRDRGGRGVARGWPKGGARSIHERRTHANL